MSTHSTTQPGTLTAKRTNQAEATETFLALLSELQKIDSEFPLQYAICLVEIALHEGLSLSSLADKTGMPLSTVSRIVGALSQNRQKGVPYGLVKSIVSENEKRRKELYLTDRGREVMSRIATIMSEQPASPLNRSVASA